jgi:outer membrane receptor protein involved in Fe transport
MQPTTLRLSQRLAALSAVGSLCLLSVSPLFAQQAAQPPSPNRNDQKEEVVELTPFTVSSAKNEGYAATSSLAGTRLNTPLKDVASAIQVVTPQFMADTGVTNITQLLVYTTNTESSGLGGNYLAGSDADSINRALSQPQRATRVRGLAEADLTRDFFLTDIGLDSYNIENVDIQRGPNSILFGLGSPAGIVNSNLKVPNLDHNRYAAEFRVGSNSKHRETFDADVALVKNQLGLRVIGMNQSQDFDQKYKFDKQKRAYLAGRWQPKLGEGTFTQITVNYEWGKTDANRPQPVAPRDAVTPFWETAKATNPDPNRQWWDTYHQNYPGLGSNWWDNVGVIYGDPNSSAIGVNSRVQGMRNRGELAQVDGGPRTWGDWNSLKFNGENIDSGHPLGKAATFANNPYLAGVIKTYTNAGKSFNGFGGFQAYRIMDPSIFDFYSTDLEGPNAGQQEQFRTVNGNIRQTYLHNLIGWEMAYAKESSDVAWQSMLDRTGGIGIDVNEFLRDGTANPNVGRPYFIGKSRGNFTRRDREAFRATVFGKVEFKRFLGEDALLAKILGESTFTGVASNQRQQYLSRDYSQYRLAPSTNGGYVETTDLWELHYIGGDTRKAANASGIAIGGLNANQMPGTSLSFFAQPPPNATSRYFTNQIQSVKDGINWLYTGADASRSSISNRSFVWQGKMLWDTVYPLFGWRSDSYRADKKPAINGNGGVFQNKNFASAPDPYDPDWTFDYQATKTGDNSASHSMVDSKSKSYGLVLALPEIIRKKLPYDTDIRVGYNKSSNFNPTSATTDAYGKQNPYQSGNTKDYSLMVDTFRGKLSLRVTKYKTSQQNVRYDLPGGQRLIGDGVQRFLNGMMKEVYYDGATWANGVKNYQTGSFSSTLGIRPQATPEWLINNWFFGTAKNWKTDPVANTPIGPGWEANKATLINEPLRIRAAALDPKYLAAFRAFGSDPTSANVQNNAPADAWQPPLTVDELNYRLWWFVNQPDSRWFGPLGSDLAQGIGLTRNYGEQNKWGFWNYDTRSFATLSDREANGMEYEVTYNPKPNWRITVNASKTESFATNIATAFDAVIKKYANVWSNGWDSSQANMFISYWDRDGWADSDTWGMKNTEDFGQYMNSDTIAHLETAKASEGKSLDQIRKWRWNVISSYDFVTGRLKGVTVGGAVRYEDKGIIGYGPKYLPALDVWISDLDHPYYVKANYHVDLWAGYRMKLRRNIDWNIQLNLYNVGLQRRLVATAAQPDGSIAEARIADGLKWELSTGFKF